MQKKADGCSVRGRNEDADLMAGDQRKLPPTELLSATFSIGRSTWRPGAHATCHLELREGDELAIERRARFSPELSEQPGAARSADE